MYVVPKKVKWKSIKDKEKDKLHVSYENSFKSSKIYLLLQINIISLTPCCASLVLTYVEFLYNIIIQW